jgi:excisionase family DNA binding protein
MAQTKTRDADSAPDRDRFLTAEEVADFLQVNTSWVYDRARRGDIPHVRLGRYVRFIDADIRAWVASLRSGP